MTALADLLARVEAAEGPDRELDALVGEGVGIRVSYSPEIVPKPLGDDGNYLPEFTASLDAALALVERVLPGWRYCVDIGPKPRGHVAFVETKAGASWQSEAATPALALLAALLKAKIAKDARA